LKTKFPFSSLCLEIDFDITNLGRILLIKKMKTKDAAKLDATPVNIATIVLGAQVESMLAWAELVNI
jgi:hypothetical protein